MKNKNKLINALWGLFISDSLSMPVHWYYKREYIKQDFGSITKYEDAKHPHPESFMVGMSYSPNIVMAQKLARPFDILHQHIKFYDTSYNTFNIQTQVHAGEHKNKMPSLEERYHYHHGLKAGENTLGANLVRVLMRSIIKQKGYKQEAFLNDFIEYMTDKEKNKDPYLEIYIRDWFENYTNGVNPELCAQSQVHRWSIGSHGGIIRPLVLSLSIQNSFNALGIAIAHQNLTHASQNVSSALSLLTPMLAQLLNDEEPMDVLKKSIQNLALIKIHGKELSKRYAQAQGPGNIPKEDMWEIHTQYSQEYLSDIIDDENMITSRFATACYPEHGLPLILYFLHKHKFDFTASLLENANAGGDNVHRGMILGLLVGAASNEIPQHLKTSLKEYETLQKEIIAFTEYCL